MTDFLSIERLGVEDYAQRVRGRGGLWVFQHIPKTAGSSIVNELRFCFPPYFNINASAASDTVSRHEALETAVEKFAEEGRSRPWRSVSGHLNHRHINTLRKAMAPLRVFTFLRDPVARVVSEFRYTRTPKHPGYEDNLKRFPTLEDYAAEDAHQDKMWRFLSPRTVEATPEEIEKIFQRHVFIGTVETLDLCFAFLTALDGYPKTLSSRENVTQGSATQALSGEAAAAIAALNARDCALYAAVSERLQRLEAPMRSYIEERRALYAGKSVEA